jgi:hypothetical protein
LAARAAHAGPRRQDWPDQLSSLVRKPDTYS